MSHVICNRGQLADARAGRRLLDDVAHYQARIAEMEKPPSESIPQACTIQRTQGSNAVAGDINARLADTIAKVKTNETSFIGVLAEDKNACYAAILQKLRTEAAPRRRRWGYTQSPISETGPSASTATRSIRIRI